VSKRSRGSWSSWRKSQHMLNKSTPNEGSWNADKDKDNNENSDNNTTAKSTKWWSSKREVFRYLSAYVCLVCYALYFCWSHALGTRSCSFDCQRQDHISTCYFCHSSPQISPSVTVPNRPKRVPKFSSDFCANPFISSPHVKLFRAIGKTGKLS